MNTEDHSSEKTLAMSSADEEIQNPNSVNEEDVVKQTLPVKRRGNPRRREVLETQVYRSPLDRSDWVFFGGLALVTALAVATRLYKITEPRHVA